MFVCLELCFCWHFLFTPKVHRVTLAIVNERMRTVIDGCGVLAVHARNPTTTSHLQIVRIVVQHGARQRDSYLLMKMPQMKSHKLPRSLARGCANNSRLLDLPALGKRRTTETLALPPPFTTCLSKRTSHLLTSEVLALPAYVVDLACTLTWRPRFLNPRSGGVQAGSQAVHSKSNMAKVCVCRPRCLRKLWCETDERCGRSEKISRSHWQDANVDVDDKLSNTRNTEHPSASFTFLWCLPFVLLFLRLFQLMALSCLCLW